MLLQDQNFLSPLRSRNVQRKEEGEVVFIYLEMEDDRIPRDFEVNINEGKIIKSACKYN